MQMNILLFFV